MAITNFKKACVQKGKDISLVITVYKVGDDCTLTPYTDVPGNGGSASFTYTYFLTQAVEWNYEVEEENLSYFGYPGSDKEGYEYDMSFQTTGFVSKLGGLKNSIRSMLISAHSEAAVTYEDQSLHQDFVFKLAFGMGKDAVSVFCSLRSAKEVTEKGKTLLTAVWGVRRIIDADHPTRNVQIGDISTIYTGA